MQLDTNEMDVLEDHEECASPRHALNVAQPVWPHMDRASHQIIHQPCTSKIWVRHHQHISRCDETICQYLMEEFLARVPKGLTHR